MIPRVKILRDSSKEKLQNNMNIYLMNITRLHAKVLHQPQIKIVKVNLQWLRKHIKSAEIERYNHSTTTFNFKLTTSISTLEKLEPRLAKRIYIEQVNASPIQYYGKISYLVNDKTLKNHYQDF